MTRSTTIAQDYDWHRKALAGEEPPIHESKPQCGWYMMRIVKDGPFVPVVIWIDEWVENGTKTQKHYCRVGHELRDADRIWSYVAKRPITKARFDYLVAKGEWAKIYAPDHPAATPHMPVDFLTAKPPF